MGTVSIVVCRVSINDATKYILCMQCVTAGERCHIKITDYSIQIDDNSYKIPDFLVSAIFV